MLRVASLLALFVACTAFAAGPSRQDRFANIDRLIEHLSKAEARQTQLLNGLENGTLVMAIAHRGGQRLPMRKSEIIEQLVSMAVIGELSRPNPNVAAAEKRGRDAAAAFFRELRPYNEREIDKVKLSRDQLRSQLMRAMKEKERLKTEPVEETMAGTWRRSDGFEVRVSGRGDSFTATATAVPSYLSVGGRAFRVGDKVWDFTRMDRSKFKGKWLFKFVNGQEVREEWRNVTVSINGNTLVPSDGTGSWTRGKS